MSAKHFLIILAIFLTTRAASGCEKPDDIALPNGATATEAEMVVANRRVQDFMSSTRAYQACLEAEARQARAERGKSTSRQIEEEENLFTRKYNASVASMKAVAERFQEEIDAYEARR